MQITILSEYILIPQKYLNTKKYSAENSAMGKDGK
jgi:hypothetical protein